MLPRVHIALRIIEVDHFVNVADDRLSRGLLMLFCGTDNNHQSYMYITLCSVPWGYRYLHKIVIRANMSSNTLNLRCCPFLCIA